MTSSHESGYSLAAALFPGTRRKVLGLLFGRPEREFTISEMIRLAETGSGAVQREVARLVESGVLRVNTRGRQKQYQANPDAPVFEELCALVRKTLGPVERVREAVYAMGDKVRLAVVFGSIAKETDRADSDIDVLLVSDELMLEDVFRAFAPLEEELGRTVNPTLYSTAEFYRRREKGNAFLRKVLAGKHVVLKEDYDGAITAEQSGSNWTP